MNTDWNTPPRGDFAAYVERLTVQTARSLSMHQTAAAPNALDGMPENPELRPNRIETARPSDKFPTSIEAPASEPPAQRSRPNLALPGRLFGGLVALLIASNILWKQPGFVPSVFIVLISWVALQAFAFAGNERITALRRKIEVRVQEAAKPR